MKEESIFKKFSPYLQKNFGQDHVPHQNYVTALLDKVKKTGSVSDKVRSGEHFNGGDIVIIKCHA